MMRLGLGIEEVLCELKEDINEQGLPPGFRFHPTDEELITFYLASQVFNPNPNAPSPSIKIAQVDLNRCEPWDLPDVAKMGEREWYFFSLRDRKYPTGLRTNRATGAGYWKATGKDREVHSSSNVLVGMKKTLVFYKGRAPRGEKTRWVMHEYRLDGQLSCRHTCKEEWVICRIFHKIKDKKTPSFEGHNTHSYFLGPSSSSPPTGTSIIPLLPSLLESEPIPVRQADPFSDVNINNTLSINALQRPPPNYYYYATNTPNKKSSKTNDNPYPSPSNVLIKSFLSNQGCSTFEDAVPIATTIPKQCKTEANFSPFLTRSHPNLSWGEPDISGLDFASLGFAPFGPADHSCLPVGTSTSFDFIRAAFGSSSSAEEESWPLR